MSNFNEIFRKDLKGQKKKEFAFFLEETFLKKSQGSGNLLPNYFRFKDEANFSLDPVKVNVFTFHFRSLYYRSTE